MIEMKAKKKPSAIEPRLDFASLTSYCIFPRFALRSALSPVYNVTCYSGDRPCVPAINGEGASQRKAQTGNVGFTHSTLPSSFCLFPRVLLRIQEPKKRPRKGRRRRRRRYGICLSRIVRSPVPRNPNTYSDREFRGGLQEIEIQLGERKGDGGESSAFANGVSELRVCTYTGLDVGLAEVSYPFVLCH